MNSNGKLRIYQLSKDLNLDYKVILKAANKLSIKANTHASSISKLEADSITNYFKEKQKAKVTKPKKNKPIYNHSIKKKPDPVDKKTNTNDVKLKGTTKSLAKSTIKNRKANTQISLEQIKNLLKPLDKLNTIKLKSIKKDTYNKSKDSIKKLLKVIKTVFVENISKLSNKVKESKNNQQSIRERFKKLIGTRNTKANSKSKQVIHNQNDTFKTLLEEAGPLIKETREKRKMSIYTVAKSISISEKNLIAIENCQEELLPEKVFVKGMIKRVSEKLGIDIKSIEDNIISNQSTRGTKTSNKSESNKVSEITPKKNTLEENSFLPSFKSINQFTNPINNEKVKNFLDHKIEFEIDTNSFTKRYNQFSNKIKSIKNLTPKNNINIGPKKFPIISLAKSFLTTKLPKGFKVTIKNKFKNYFTIKSKDKTRTISTNKINKTPSQKKNSVINLNLKNLKKKLSSLKLQKLIEQININQFKIKSKVFFKKLLASNKSNSFIYIDKLKILITNLLSSVSFLDSKTKEPKDKLSNKNTTESKAKISQDDLNNYYLLLKSYTITKIQKLKQKIYESDIYKKYKPYINNFIVTINNKYLKTSKLQIPLINLVKSKKDKTNRIIIPEKEVKETFDFVAISYSDHKLSLSHICKSDSRNIVKDHIRIDIPADIAGDFKVENNEELTSIILDVIEVFGLSNPPVILLLASSFFTARTFNDKELVVFSEDDSTLLSKSPFIPPNTTIQYQRVSGDRLSSYHRVIYVEKSIIESWISVLETLDLPIVGLTATSLSVVEHLASQNKEEITVLTDIEYATTTLYIQKSNCELITINLPYGSSLYTSKDQELVTQFFIRLTDSINKYLKKESYLIPSKIYVTGTGLDILTNSEKMPIENFERFPLKDTKPYILNSKDLINVENDNISTLTFCTLVLNNI